MSEQLRNVMVPLGGGQWVNPAHVVTVRPARRLLCFEPDDPDDGMRTVGSDVYVTGQDVPLFTTLHPNAVMRALHEAPESSVTVSCRREDLENTRPSLITQLVHDAINRRAE